jgi:hypothetical protein
MSLDGLYLRGNPKAHRVIGSFCQGLWHEFDGKELKRIRLMIDLPTTVAEIDRLIVDEVQESLYLDYKDSRAVDSSKFGELAKDVSAFANSDGGVIIYGIQEKDHLPLGKDGGVEHNKYSRERLEQVISSNISPRIDDIRIAQIPLSAATSIYVIGVPKSFRAPHQSSDKKYYKRYNFQSLPMEDYEINDIRSRKRIAPPLVNVGIHLKRRVVYLTISNVGEQAAEDVTFELPNELLPWVEEQKARVFIGGIKYLPPKRTYNFRYGISNALLQPNSKNPARFDIRVSYVHPEIGQRISDEFHIDLFDYWGSYTPESEIHEQGREITEAIKKLTSEVEKLSRQIAPLTKLAGATGLNLSVATIRNLRHVIDNLGHMEKFDPSGLDYDVFMEVLGVDIETAYNLSDFFYQGNESNRLGSVEGVTEELIEKIKKHFILADAPIADDTSS